MTPSPDKLEAFQRDSSNPILRAEDWPYPAQSVFNAGATLVEGPGGTETVLLVRVEDRSGRSHLTVARSADGAGNWRIDASPTFLPDREGRPEEAYGVEDPRIIRLDEEGYWAILYTAYGADGPAVAWATTTDFETFERRGTLSWPDNKDAAFFPRRIGGAWWMIHRPTSGFSGAQGHMWVSTSPDLIHWGNHRVLLRAHSGGWWDAGKIGLNTPPLETSEGWLVLYHGVRVTGSGMIYRLGLALLDRDHPGTVLSRPDEWVFGPRTPWERGGDVGNVVFPCGWTLVDGEVRLYYGAADTCIGLARATLEDLLEWVRP